MLPSLVEPSSMRWRRRLLHLMNQFAGYWTENDMGIMLLMTCFATLAAVGNAVGNGYGIGLPRGCRCRALTGVRSASD